MEPDTKEIGRMIYSMDSESKNGRTDQAMKDSIEMAGNTVKENIYGAIKVSMMAIGLTTKLLVTYTNHVIYQGVYQWNDGRRYAGEW